MAPPMDPVASGPTRRPEKLRMIFADDSAVTRHSIAEFLGTLECIDLRAVCEDGRAVIEEALRDQPDAVLLDLQMPVMSGLEAAQVFRTCLPETAVIIMTVHDHPEVRAACLAGGADAFVSKSTLVREFDAAIGQATLAAEARMRNLTRTREVSKIEALSLLSQTAGLRQSFRKSPAGRVETKDLDSGHALPLDGSAPSLRRVS